MTTLESVKNILIGFIIAGSVLRMIACAIRMIANPDDKEVQKKRILKAVAFMVVSVGLAEITDRVISYFGISTL